MRGHKFWATDHCAHWQMAKFTSCTPTFAASPKAHLKAVRLFMLGYLYLQCQASVYHASYYHLPIVIKHKVKLRQMEPLVLHLCPKKLWRKWFIYRMMGWMNRQGIPSEWKNGYSHLKGRLETLMSPLAHVHPHMNHLLGAYSLCHAVSMSLNVLWQTLLDHVGF